MSYSYIIHICFFIDKALSLVYNRGMIWFVGRSLQEYKDYFDTIGLEYGVFVDEHREISPVDSRLHRVEVDFSSEDSIKNSLESATADVDGLLCVYETYVFGVSVIAEHYGLPSISKSSALTCTDKVVMRQNFHDYDPSISPDFCEVRSQKDIDEFMASHSFPVILKPANLVKSILVTKNNDTKELQANYKKTIDTIHNIYQKHSVKRAPKVLIEEFMDGTVHSIDALVDANGRIELVDEIVDYQTGYDIGRDENYHFSRKIPSHLPNSTKQQIKEVAIQGIKALGIKCNPAHVEVIVTKDGPKIVEIGARIGGYRFRMHKYANGVDLLGEAIKIARGDACNLNVEYRKSCAVLELFPEKNGKFVGVENEDKLLKLKTLVRYRVVPEIGQMIGVPREGERATAIVTLGSEAETELERDLEFIKNHVKVTTG